MWPPLPPGSPPKATREEPSALEPWEFHTIAGINSWDGFIPAKIGGFESACQWCFFECFGFFVGDSLLLLLFEIFWILLFRVEHGLVVFWNCEPVLGDSWKVF